MHISSKCTTLVRYPHSYKAIISSFLRCFWWFLCLIEPLKRRVESKHLSMGSSCPASSAHTNLMWKPHLNPQSRTTSTRPGHCWLAGPMPRCCRSILVSVTLLFINGTQENPTNHHRCCQICTRAPQYEVPHRKEQGAFRWDVSPVTCTAATRKHRAGIFLAQRKNRMQGWDLEQGGRKMLLEQSFSIS